MTGAAAPRSVSRYTAYRFAFLYDDQPFPERRNALLLQRFRSRAEMTVTLGRGDPHPGSGFAPLQGTFAVSVRPEDKAVYIGTIRYHRDIFFGTEKVEIVDEYAETQSEYWRKFGGGLVLRKALVQPVAGN